MQALYQQRGVFIKVFKADIMLPPDEEMKRRHPDCLAVFYPPGEEICEMTDCHVLHDLMARYLRVVGCTEGSYEGVPPAALTGYLIKMILACGSSELSRTPVLGTIHRRQEITIYHDLTCLLTEPFSIKLHIMSYRQMEKGVEADGRGCVYDKGGRLMWEGTMTGVTFGPKKKGSKHKEPKPNMKRRTSKVLETLNEETITTTLRTGIQFASAVGDNQPQHMYGWTAKLVGFKAPIAHGMWTMAVALDRIMRKETVYKSTYPLHAKVNFKQPFVLGTDALMRYTDPIGDSNLAKFQVLKKNGEHRTIIDGIIYTGKTDIEL